MTNKSKTVSVYLLLNNESSKFTKVDLNTIKSISNLHIVDSIDEVLNIQCKNKFILAVDPDMCQWRLPNEVFDIENLVSVCLQTTSYRWVDINYAKTRAVIVTNIKDFCTNSVAEWAVMMALNVARRIPLIIKNDWKQDFTKHMGLELTGKRVGIIGMGNIGTRIAEICEGMGMEVNYWSRKSKDERFTYRELANLFKESDIIFPAFATGDAKGLITDEMLRSIKDTGIISTIVNNRIYNHELILQLVKEGKLFGYAFEDTGSIFDYEGNVWTGMEMAWYTEESVDRNYELWAKNIIEAVYKIRNPQSSLRYD